MEEDELLDVLAPLAIWAVAAVPGAISLVWWYAWRGWRRARPAVGYPTCVRCQYDLRASLTGRTCPECGADLRAAGYVPTLIQRPLPSAVSHACWTLFAPAVIAAVLLVGVRAGLLPRLRKCYGQISFDSAAHPESPRSGVTLWTRPGFGEVPDESYLDVGVAGARWSWRKADLKGTISSPALPEHTYEVTSPGQPVAAIVGRLYELSTVPPDAPEVAAERADLTAFVEQTLAALNGPRGQRLARLDALGWRDRDGATATRSFVSHGGMGWSHVSYPGWYAPAAAALWLSVWGAGAWAVARRSRLPTEYPRACPPPLPAAAGSPNIQSK